VLRDFSHDGAPGSIAAESRKLRSASHRSFAKSGRSMLAAYLQGGHACDSGMARFSQESPLQLAL
jgi:hypothetical protein